MVPDQEAITGRHRQLAFDDLEDALLRLGDPVVLCEDYGLEVAAQADGLGQLLPFETNPNR